MVKKIVFMKNDASVKEFDRILEMYLEHDVIYVKGMNGDEEIVYIGRLSELMRVSMVERRK